MITSSIKTLFFISTCTCIFAQTPNKTNSKAIKNSNAVIQTPKKLDPHLPPSANFDLSNWSLTIPSDIDNNGKPDKIYETELSSGYENKNFFLPIKMEAWSSNVLQKELLQKTPNLLVLNYEKC